MIICSAICYVVSGVMLMEGPTKLIIGQPRSGIQLPLLPPLPSICRSSEVNEVADVDLSKIWV
jgi:hypothetical protein